MSQPRREPPAHWKAMLLGTVAFAFAWGVGPFLAAGTWRWLECWGYFAVLLLGQALHRRYVARRNPELLERRRRIGKGTKRWDVVWNLFFWPQIAAAPIVAGLGVRQGWPFMPWLAFPVGVALYAAGTALSARAMAVNPHFEGTVRIQEELGHRVIDAGPYSVLRHPGYAGLALWALAGPLLLRSWAALVPAGTVIAWLVVRTVLEDALLRRELPGYADYAARVRWRLCPGLF